MFNKASDADKKLARLKMLSDDDKSSLQGMEIKVEELRMELSNKDVTIAAVQRNFEGLSELCRNDKVKIAALEKELNDMKAAMSTVKELTDANAAHTKALATYKTEVEKYQREIKSLISDSETSEKDLEAVRKQNHNLQVELDAYRVRTGKMKTSVEEKSMEVDRLTSQNKSLTKRLQECENELATCKQELPDAKRQKKNMELLLQDAIRERDEIKMQFDSFNGEKVEFQNRLRFLQNERDKFQDQFQRVREERDNMEVTVKNLRTEIDHLHEVRRSLAKDNDQKVSAVSDLEAGFARERDSLQQQVEELRNTIAENKKDRDLLTHELHNVKLEVGNYKGQLATLLDRLDNDEREFKKKLEDQKRYYTEEMKRQQGDFAEKLRMHQLDKENLKANSEDYMQELKKKVAAAERLCSEESNAKKLVQRELDIMKAELEKVEEQLLNTQYDERMKDLLKKEASLKDSVQKLILAEEAVEPSLTCLHCMEIFADAVTMVPCGHSYCHSCLEALLGGGDVFCSECGPDTEVTVQFRNDTLDHLCSKHAYKRQILEGISEQLERGIKNA